MVEYTLKKFEDLSLHQLYEIMVLRQEVFVVEQDCAYLDADNKDQKCHHVIGTDENGTIQSYARLVPKGISYEKYNSIGRVITSSAYRGMGEGKSLMLFCIKEIQSLYPQEQTKISAQVYAIPFYTSFGFVEYGEHYDEDGIQHSAMIL